MVSMSNKAQMQAIVDAMLDDEVLLDDFLVKGAGLRAHRQAAQPTEWIKFCKLGPPRCHRAEPRHRRGAIEAFTPTNPPIAS